MFQLHNRVWFIYREHTTYYVNNLHEVCHTLVVFKVDFDEMYTLEIDVFEEVFFIIEYFLIKLFLEF